MISVDTFNTQLLAPRTHKNIKNWLILRVYQIARWNKLLQHEQGGKSFITKTFFKNRIKMNCNINLLLNGYRLACQTSQNVDSWPNSNFMQYRSAKKHGYEKCPSRLLKYLYQNFLFFKISNYISNLQLIIYKMTYQTFIFIHYWPHTIVTKTAGRLKQSEPHRIIAKIIKFLRHLYT